MLRRHVHYWRRRGRMGSRWADAGHAVHAGGRRKLRRADTHGRGASVRRRQLAMPEPVRSAGAAAMTIRRIADAVCLVLCALILAATALVACSANWNAPLPVTPEPGAPCGITGVVCSGKMCCESGEICGGPPPVACPISTCCFV